ncbi:MerC domain-containing protein [Pedobacter sp. MC2016-24]|uniref:MerC domain-containing protein n=1 Tax=Pedobacter sp. MC2016-24 TaxID=2780090 RepID=UPI00188040E9|nr:MerC domain-containing protein [Pedobacter sp. MC2016-24]MBE9601415.1 MerC domain-containing protein [Pedobacter sp. MC2016-24]
MRSKFKSGKLDQFGMTAAIACAIHCAALPFVITTLPLWGLNFLAHSWVELGMICLSLIIGIWSLTSSYPKHKKALPLLVLLAGFAMIACGHYWLEDLEAVLIPLGGFSIATAHLFNWRYSRTCNHLKNNNTAVANPLQG